VAFRTNERGLDNSLLRLRGLVEAARAEEAETLIAELKANGGAGPAVREAELILAFLSADVNRAVEAADHVRADAGHNGNWRSPVADAFAVGAYLYAGRVADAVGTVDSMPSGPARLVARYVLGVARDDPSCPIPGPTGTALDGLVMRAQAMRGDWISLRDLGGSDWARTDGLMHVLTKYMASAGPFEIRDTEPRVVCALYRAFAFLTAHDRANTFTRSSRREKSPSPRARRSTLPWRSSPRPKPP
jgi:hypothetical protein